MRPVSRVLRRTEVSEGHRREADAAFRFLCLGHTLLGYVSALGAHRQRIEGWQLRPLLMSCLDAIDGQLQALAQQLASGGYQPLPQVDPLLAKQLELLPAAVALDERRLLRQLALIHGQLPELTLVIDQLLEGRALAK